jgi:hypothetical protein
MFRLAAIAFALVSTTAEAAPVYLHCQFNPATDENHNVAMDVTLNESEGTVTYTFPNNPNVISSKAAFLANSVAFGSSPVVMADGSTVTLGGFTIDRTNLSLTERKMDIPNAPITADTQFTFRFVPVGSCAVVQPKRAF